MKNPYYPDADRGVVTQICFTDNGKFDNITVKIHGNCVVVTPNRIAADAALTFEQIDECRRIVRQYEGTTASDYQGLPR